MGIFFFNVRKCVCVFARARFLVSYVMVNAFSLAERITRSVSKTTNHTPVDATGLRRVEAGALSVSLYIYTTHIYTTQNEQKKTKLHSDYRVGGSFVNQTEEEKKKPTSNMVKRGELESLACGLRFYRVTAATSCSSVCSFLFVY